MTLSHSLFLAQDSSAATTYGAEGNALRVLVDSISSNMDVLTRPGALSEVVTNIHIVWATIFILVGAACVVNGYKWHKIVVVILAGMSGVWAGSILGDSIGDATVVTVCLSVLFAVLAWPLLRYAVALFGGLAGAFAGANLWTAVAENPDQHRIGALLGLVGVGLLAFMAFRAVVIVMTAIGGASLLCFGALAALYHVETLQSGLVDSMNNHRLVIPLIAASAAAVGAVVQFSGGFKGMAELANKADSSKAGAKKAA
jgi:hypothetical protein